MTPAVTQGEEIVERAEAPMRELHGRLRAAVLLVLALMSLYHLYAVVATIPTQVFRVTHLMFALPLALVVFPAAKRARTLPWYDVALALLAVAATGYGLVDFDAFVERAVTPSTWDVVMGALLVLLVLEATRRAVGVVLASVVAAFLLYAWFGDRLPGGWAHRGYDLPRMVGHLYMTLEGIFGVPLDVAATYIILFTMYGAILQATGAGQCFVDLALAVAGTRRSGPGRGVVLASLLLGAVTGSGVATTVTVGSVTWPLLERAGYPREAAAGLLAAAGIGAVISPPVMGAAAFLIAEFAQVSYLTVMRYALIPTLLYYLGVLLMIELDVRRYRLHAVDLAVPAALPLLRRGWHHVLSLCLIVGLLVAGLTPTLAATWAIAVAVAASFLHRDAMMLDRRFLVLFLAVAAIAFGVGMRTDEGLGLRNATTAVVWGVLAMSGAALWAGGATPLVAALAAAARQVLPVSITTAGAGIVIGVVSLTGLGLKFSDLIVGLGAGSSVLTLVLAAVSVWILGLALPITASYLIAAVIVAPALVRLGLPVYAAHMFIFYYAVLSEVSPPVGLSPLAASAITGASFGRAMMEAWRYTLPVFAVPFAFATGSGGHALLMQSAPLDVLLTAGTAVLGLTALVIAGGGWLAGPLGWRLRLLVSAGGLLLLYADPVADLLGAALGGVGAALAVTGHVERRTESAEQNAERRR